MTEFDVIVVGGGISGLASAWELQQAGFRVKVLERAQRSGGKICSNTYQGYLMESAASMVVDFNSQVTSFLERTGLAHRQVERQGGTRMKRYLLHQQTLREVSESLMGVMKMPCWSQRGRWRMLAEILVPRGNDESETVSSFVRRRLGNEVLENAIEPLVAGTWASDPDRANACSVLPRLTMLEQRFGSIIAGVLVRKLHPGSDGGRQRVFSFDRGMETLVRSLAGRLDVMTGCQVKQLNRHRDCWAATTATPDGEKILKTRHIVLSVPALQASRLLHPVDPVLAGLLSGIGYTSMTVVHMGFDRGAIAHALDGSGFLTPRKAGLRINGNLWPSSTFAGRAPGAKTLLTTYIGGARNPQAINWDDSRVTGQALNDLKPLLGIRCEPEMVSLKRHTQALPLYYGNYAKRQREIAGHLQHVPGLYLQANYLGGIAVRDRIIQAAALTRRVQSASTDHDVRSASRLVRLTL